MKLVWIGRNTEKQQNEDKLEKRNLLDISLFFFPSKYFLLRSVNPYNP